MTEMKSGYSKLSKAPLLTSCAALISTLFLFNSAQAAEQCVTNNAGYFAWVAWYPANSLTVDNSEPWNNRLLLRRRVNGGGRCGTDIKTGKKVCQGSHINPVRKKDKLGRFGLVNDHKSCINGDGKYVAVVHCIGCAQGTSFLRSAGNAILGSALSVVTPAGAIGNIITAASTAAASQGISTDAAIGKVLEGAKGAFMLNEKVGRKVKIHDVSDLPNIDNLVYAGTPKNLYLRGTISRPHSGEAGKVTAPFSAYSYRVTIDCTKGGIDNEGTENNISVLFYIKGEAVYQTDKDGQDIACKVGRKSPVWTTNYLYDPVSGEAFDRVDKIVIETNGDDGFFIDEIEVTATYGHGAASTRDLIEANFVDGGKKDNFCLSTDPMDGSRSWADYIPGKRCKKSLPFNLK